MKNKGLMAKCPFRDGTASKAIYATLARASKPLSVEDVWRKSKMPLAKVKTLVAAYFNVMHNAPLRKVGVELVRDEDGRVRMKSCKADPKARRPERGKSKKKAVRKTPRRKSTPKKATSKSASKPESAPPAPEPATPPAPQSN